MRITPKRHKRTTTNGAADAPGNVTATGGGVVLSDKGIASRDSESLFNSATVKQTIQQVAQIPTKK